MTGVGVGEGVCFERASVGLVADTRMLPTARIRFVVSVDRASVVLAASGSLLRAFKAD